MKFEYIHLYHKYYKEAGKTSNGLEKISLGHKILELSNHINSDTTFILQGYGNLVIGRGNAKLGKLVDAFHYHNDALKYFRAVNHLKGQANTLHSLSFIYSSQKDYKKALECDLQTRRLYQKLKDKKRESIATSNIGDNFYLLLQYDSALHYSHLGLKLAQEVGKERLSYYNLGNIGLSHLKLQNLDSAYLYLNQAIEGLDKYKDNYALSFYTVGLGEYHLLKKNYTEAETWTIKGLALAEESNLLEQELDASKALAEVYQHLGNYEKAFQFEKQANLFQDSLLNLEKLQELERLKVQQELEQKDHEIAQLEKEKEEIVKEGVSEAMIKGYGFTLFKTEVYLSLFITSFIVFFGFAFTWRFWQRKFQLQEESQQQAGDKVVEYEQTISSMSQAGDFQQQVFPSKEILETVGNGSFVFFKPLEYISGDFYYVGECKDYKIAVVGDATGHGAQGGLISMLGFSLLEEVIVRQEICDPGEILEYLDKQFKDLLRSNVIADFNGMSISIVAHNPKKNIFKFAGAKHDLTMVRKDEKGHPQLEYIRGNRRFVGDSSTHNLKPFDSVIFSLTDEETMIYLYSDGYKDQLGGARNKKYNYKKFRDFLYKIHHYSLGEQQELLKFEMENWMSRGVFQVDDFLVMGINLSATVAEEIEYI
ncbi:SpoIIE family protein phosphatase [Sediminitomix flava]|uniref:Serine phosphatase RsbU (Regulator of sigma subunit) n=1 Tax=Sediminitomix flava TaxID=379075 RepID=A0A315ZEP5_SEDFL|nr:SpoIIE family protein phosphatase [Sediminitomix flava]PWJ44035.1 serine phosphatase RsbU (regulator of sigma subunit) [Sediminitomix flava]